MYLQRIGYHLHEMVEKGEVISAQPWPAGLGGYQPGTRWADDAPLSSLPDPVTDERQWNGGSTSGTATLQRSPGSTTPLS